MQTVFPGAAMAGKKRYCEKCGIESTELGQDERGRYLCPRCRGIPPKPEETRRERMRRLWENDDSVSVHTARRRI